MPFISVTGLSIDFVVASVIGFVCYSIYTISFYAIPSIQKEYRDTHDGNDNLVKINDVFFAVHALAITLIYSVQVLIYRVPKIIRYTLKLITYS